MKYPAMIAVAVGAVLVAAIVVDLTPDRADFLTGHARCAELMRSGKGAEALACRRELTGPAGKELPYRAGEKAEGMYKARTSAAGGATSRRSCSGPFAGKRRTADAEEMLATCIDDRSSLLVGALSSMSVCGQLMHGLTEPALTDDEVFGCYYMQLADRRR